MSVLVSINCITYNHEKYIHKAIDSFLMQVTDFDYEIIIGEDCSTDDTLKIVNEYKAKFPDMIKIVTDIKNVGMKKNSRRILEASSGKFIAICEGDDYWTDPYKLQKQVDFMRKHKDCSMVFHGSEIMNVITGKIEGEICPFKETLVLNDKHLFYGGGDIVGTASLLFVREIMLEKPRFFIESPVGDHAIALLMSAKGRIGYINEKMSVRTLWVPNSWNTKFNQKKDIKKSITHIEAMENVLVLYNIYTENRFDIEIRKHILNGKIEVAKLRKQKPFKNKEIIDYYSKFSLLDKFKIKVGIIFPQCYLIYDKIRCLFSRT